MYEINYNWDKAAFLKASKELYNYEFNNSNKKYIGWIFIALTQFGVVAALKKGAFGLLFISTFLVIYWYYFRWKLREFLLKKSFKDIDKKVQILANNDFLEINSKKFDYNNIKNLIKLENGYVIIVANKSFYIPKKVIKNEFITFLKSKIKEE